MKRRFSTSSSSSSWQALLGFYFKKGYPVNSSAISEDIPSGFITVRTSRVTKSGVPSPSGFFCIPSSFQEGLLLIYFGQIQELQGFPCILILSPGRIPLFPGWVFRESDPHILSKSKSYRESPVSSFQLIKRYSYFHGGICKRIPCTMISRRVFWESRLCCLQGKFKSYRDSPASLFDLPAETSFPRWSSREDLFFIPFNKFKLQGFSCILIWFPKRRLCSSAESPAGMDFSFWQKGLIIVFNSPCSSPASLSTNLQRVLVLLLSESLCRSPESLGANLQQVPVQLFDFPSYLGFVCLSCIITVYSCIFVTHHACIHMHCLLCSLLWVESLSPL